MAFQHSFSTQRFGIDYGGPLPEEDDREDAIVVPRVNHGISSSDYYDLCLAIDPTIMALTSIYVYWIMYSLRYYQSTFVFMFECNFIEA